MDSFFVLSLLLVSTVFVTSQSTTVHSSSVSITPSSPPSSSTKTAALPTPPKPTSHASVSPSTSKIAPSSARSSSHPTSTSVPTTTTKPTTTAKPTTTPKPEPHFAVKDSKGNACLSIEGYMSIFVHSDAIKMNLTEVHLKQDGAVVTGHCLKNTTGDNTTDITIKYGKTVTFMLKFTSNKEMWYLSEVMVNATVDSVEFAASADFEASSNDKLYQASLNKSYVCTRSNNLTLSKDKNNSVIVDFKSVKIQPFESTGKPFRDPMMCPATSDAGKNSSIVPIAVGCALAGLIVIVLIAYLIGRRKNGRGYQQV